jgi:N utilization substance protein B
MTSKHHQRHLGRELALQWLFQIEVGEQPAAEVMTHVPEDVEELETLEEDGVAYAQVLGRGVLANRQELDRIIIDFAKGWPLDRMAAIERNILRIALFEILHLPDVPASVTVDEAVEIAKHYASDESGKFVNGILGAYLRSDEGKRVEKEQA